MRFLTIGFALLAGLTIALDGAVAASNYYLNPNDPNAAAACVAQGGSVQADSSLRQVCVFRPACAPANLPYVVNPNDPNAAQACAAACGTIAQSPSGQYVCVSLTQSREPSHGR